MFFGRNPRFSGELVRHLAVDRPGTVGFPSRTLFRSECLVFRFRSILVLLPLLVLHGVGCQNAPVERSRPASTVNTTNGGQRMLPGEESEAGLDFGEDWDAVERHLGGGSSPRAAGTEGSGGLDLSGQTAARVDRIGYGIVLGSFGSSEHGIEADQYRKRLSILVPTLASGLRICTVSEGSLVVYGDYAGWRDETARDDLKRLRDLTVNDQQLFPTAMLTEIKPVRDPASIGEDELLWVRVQYPDIRVLYTLEVAIWSDFESGTLTVDQRRREAIRYARVLRQQGFPAFHHHDEARNMSMVTIGVFDHSAIDASSGLKSAQVERLMMDFPQRMVNGEPLVNLYDPQDPSKGGRPQPPRLVEVPKL